MLTKDNKHEYTKNSQLPYRCIEALYMSTLLEHGFGFDGSHRNITLALEVLGHEVEWTLGFALAEVPLPYVHSNLNSIDTKNNNRSIRQNFKRIKIFTNIHYFVANFFQLFFQTFRNVGGRIYNIGKLLKSVKI
jgi:hypothetical protein